MKILPIATFALTLLAAALPLVSPVQAGTAIQRCAAADGTTVYTDTPCSLLEAASRPLSSELLNRIARDQANAAPSAGATGIATATTVAAVSRRSAAAGCARTPTQLTMDLRGALALGDVNRLAESYHWVGLSQRQSRPIMQLLERLAAQPLEDAQYYDARIGAGGMQLASAGGGNTASGLMQLRFGGRSRQVTDFDVERYAGCYFIRL